MSSAIDISAENQQLMDAIQSLQETETNLFAQFENPNLTSDDKNNIIERMNELAALRIRMYKTIYTLFSTAQQTATETTHIMNQQMAAIRVMEKQLNDTKRKINIAKSKRNDTLRLVEINTYFGKQYEAYTHFLQRLVLVCAILICVGILANSGIIPASIGNVLFIGVGIIGGIWLFLFAHDISNRDNMNFDVYNWRFSPSSAPAPEEEGSSSSSSTSVWAQTESTPTCVGAECCEEGDTYDTQLNKCVSN